MKKLYIFILFLVTIGTLVFGKIYSDQKIEAEGKKTNAEYQAQLKLDQQKKQELINSLDPNKNKNLSFVDYLHYNLLKKNETKITVFGSSVTFGSGATDRAHSWAGLLQNKLAISIPGAENLTLTNHGVPGYSANDIINHNVLDSVIKDKPDLIIFETCLLNSQGQSQTIEKTLNDINAIVTRLKNELPNAKIILMSPNPSTTKMNPATATNKVHLTYVDYLNSVKKYATDNGWYYFDAYTAINKTISDRKLSLDKLLMDGAHPNNDGYEIWFEALYDYLNQKQVNL